MKKILLLSFALACATVNAQYSYSSGGAFTFGVQSSDADPLLALSPGAPDLSSVHFSFGGYGAWQFQRFMIGFKGAGLYGPTASANGFEYSAQSGYWSLDLGYKVINRDRFGLYPLVGIGWGGSTYSIAADQDYVVTDPIAFNSVEYQWSGLVLDIGLRAEHLFGFKQMERGKGGGMFGLELGYMFSPGNSDWKTLGGGSVIDAPDYGLDGFYARVLIGGMGGK